MLVFRSLRYDHYIYYAGVWLQHAFAQFWQALEAIARWRQEKTKNCYWGGIHRSFRNTLQHILYPIPRHSARQNLGLSDALPFQGVDLWHAYELSWLDKSGKPVVRVGRFSVPATSPNIVESKSFKLYLNSLNNSQFSCDEEARGTITTDISAVAGADVSLDLYAVDDPALAGTTLRGECLDECTIEP